MLKIAASMLLFLSLAITHCLYAQIGFRLGADSTDYGKDLALDKNGNIIVAGLFSGSVDFDPSANTYTLSSLGNTDNFIAKYNADGVYRWAIGFGSNGFDSPSTIDLDESGNIYICGYVSGSTDFDPGSGIAIQPAYGLKDAYVAKYDSNGQYLWAHTFGAELDDQANDIKIDKNSTISLTGAFQDTVDFNPGAGSANLISRGGEDVFIARYNATGDYQWGVNVGTTNDDQGMALEVDTAGYSYVSGFMWREEIIPKYSAKTITGPKTAMDIFLVKCASSGSVLYTKRMGGTGINQTAHGGITLDADGNVYITGGFSDTVDFNPGSGVTNLISHGSEDVFVAKYTSQGILQLCFGFGGSDQDRASKIVVDGDGNILISGWFRGAVDFDPGDGVYLINSHGTSGASDIFIAKYTFQGVYTWVNSIGASVSNSDYNSLAATIKLDSIGNSFVTGKYFGTCDFDPSSSVYNLASAGLADIFIVKYNGNGEIWSGIPEFSVDPKTLPFGPVPVGVTQYLGTVVYNSGDGYLQIDSLYSTDPHFTVTSSVVRIAPFKFQEYVVSFTPPDIGSYSGEIIIYHNVAGGKDTIDVTGTGSGTLADIQISISPGWNMLSVPVWKSDTRKSVLFPSAVSSAFAFGAGSYIIDDTLNRMTGYWLKFDSIETVTLSGAAHDLDTVVVRQGWNLIGCIAYPVLASSIVKQPPDIVTSKYYGYSNLYFESTSLIPGKGYWVKASKAGRLILSAQ